MLLVRTNIFSVYVSVWRCGQGCVHIINVLCWICHLLVEFDPGEVPLGVGVLEAEEPDLSQSYRLDDLVEQLLAGRRLLDRELQLRVHSRHADVHLE